MKTKTAFAMFALCITLALAACGPTTYVQQQPTGYESGYVDPYYDPLAVAIMFNGQRGYYDSYHTFHTVVILNGAEGYYDNSHRFVSSSPVIRQAVQSKKPLYVGTDTRKPDFGSGGGAGRGPAKPDFGSGGGSGRGPAPATKPNFGSGGGATRTSSVAAPSSKPSFGSGGSSRRSK